MKKSQYIKIFIAIFLSILIFPSSLYASEWLKADNEGGEKVWIDTSHWDTKKVLISDGYWEQYLGKRWVDQSYYVNRNARVWVDDSYKVEKGYWKTEKYRVWVNSGYTHYYQARKWVDTSHYETRYRTIASWRPVNFTIYKGCTSYGWGVYSFAKKYKGHKYVRYNGTLYMAHKWEIDYRPSYGGRVHAIKYQFTHKEVRIRQPYRVWINSGYWKYYMTHYHVDTSHWETRTRKVWVDNSYIVKKGHWEYRNEKVLIKDGYYKTYTAYRWVDKSYYKTEKTWVNDGYYAESLHGNVTVIKNPEYVFTKWHKDNNGNESCMELKITWAIENGKIKKIKVYEELQRYDGKGIENIDIIDSKINLKAEGSISKTIKFEHPGSKSSKLHIYLYGEDGRVAHVYCSNPVNGFHSINIEKNGTEKNADKWLGGNSYGKIEI